MKIYISSLLTLAPSLKDISTISHINNKLFLEKEIDINTSLIPTNIRRRCSRSSKIAISISLPQFNFQHIDAAVFASQHGELNNTINILKDISNNQILSPNSFSQSVHNTPSGLISAHKNLSIPFNSIAANKETFQMGLIDSITQLQDFNTVLLTVFDDNVPEIFNELNIKYNLAYGVSFIVSKKPISGSSQAIDLSINKKNISYNSIPPALIFASWLTKEVKETLILSKLTIQRN
ncbi:hypothetical protein fh0823_20120 [Francisella halioticida]|uniref:Beta-ketoacyl synthase-like N-terminal domain-containing protein n=1 Tax=Francisella halioticida TaxID=549298 RepID=A0ABM6M262_9GAMM|nr:beta-ketoacyl synthase chain length factor [Francisella halioticida]ASG68884.1 hypothetical protein CDV26_11305 [Francisella halioticida]BCD91873.1 hypothetical protein fh0823_20120 [Francisella halioticida]